MTEAQTAARVARTLLGEPRFVVYGRRLDDSRAQVPCEYGTVLFPPYSLHDQDELRNLALRYNTLAHAYEAARSLNFYYP